MRWQSLSVYMKQRPAGAGTMDFLALLLARKGAATKRDRAGPGAASARALRPGVQVHYSQFLNTKTYEHRRRGHACHHQPTCSIVMALARPLPPLWQTLLPTLNGPARPVLNLPLLQRLAQPFRSIPTPFAALAIPLSLPSLPSLSDIWEGVLKAVPKKKTSYMKKRTRFMAGKGLKDLTNLNKCSACGRVKRSHFLCPYCVDGTSRFITFSVEEHV